MNEDLQHIDDLFKAGLEGKEEFPSASVWTNIEKELDRKDSRPKFFRNWDTRKIAAAILIFLGSAGLFAGGYYLGIKKDNKTESQVKPSGKKTSSSISEPEQNQNTVDQPATQKQSGELSQEDLYNRSSSSINFNEKDQVSVSGSTDEMTASNDHNTTETQGKSNPSKVNEQKANDVKLNAVGTNKSAGTDLGNAGSETNKGTGSTVKSMHQIAAAGTVTKGKAPASSTKSGPEKPGARTQSNELASEQKNSVAQETQGAEEAAYVYQFPARSWEPELLTARSTREIPATQKHISSASKQALGSDATPAATIPVLNKNSSAVDLPRFSLTPVFNMQFNSNRIKATNDPHASMVKEDITRTESQPMSFSGGILADLKISKNMTLQSGIIFTNRTIEIEPKYIKAERNPDGKVRYKMDCSAGTYYLKKSTYARPGDSALTKFSTNELKYINVPLALTYHFGGKKFHMYATAGAGLNILTDQYLETGLAKYNYSEEESISTNLQSNYFNGTIGAGIDYRPFNRVSFLFSPQYQFALSPMNENMPIKAYPRIFNLQFGMKIRL